MAGTLPAGTLAEAHKFDCEENAVECVEKRVKTGGKKENVRR